MPALPPAASFTAPTVTEGQFKAAVEALRAYTVDLLGDTGVGALAAQSLGLPFAGYETRTTAFTLTANDAGRTFSVTAGVTVTIPAAATMPTGYMVILRASNLYLTFATAAGDTIDGGTTYGVEPYQVMILHRVSSTAWATYLFQGAEGSGTFVGGSNGNGRWMRGLDGSQWCWRNGQSTGAIDLTPGNGFRSADNVWVFPANFTTYQPNIVCWGHTSARSHWVSFGTISATQVAWRANGFTSSSALTANLAVMGRWK